MGEWISLVYMTVCVVNGSPLATKTSVATKLTIIHEVDFQISGHPLTPLTHLTGRAG
jgi:hypothetical protein